MHPQTDIGPLLPLIIPLFLLQIGLLVAALIHIFTHKHYRVGKRWVWVLVAIVGYQVLIGPILYFVLGRSDEGRDGD